MFVKKKKKKKKTRLTTDKFLINLTKNVAKYEKD
jgi:hypothetical protein